MKQNEKNLSVRAGDPNHTTDLRSNNRKWLAMTHNEKWDVQFTLSRIDIPFSIAYIFNLMYSNARNILLTTIKMYNESSLKV